MTEDNSGESAGVGRRRLLKGAGAVGTAGVLGAVATTGGADGPSAARSADWGDQPEPEPYEEYNVLRVSKNGDAPYEAIQPAINDAEPRDLVLIEPGVYTEQLEVNETPRLTIRGTDRNEVVIDGEYGDYTGITITSDDVAVENLTVKRWTYGVYWVGVEGYRGSYITTHHTTEYGIYAFNSEHGRFEYCHASGNNDAGFYIGESQPGNAVITDCISEYNALGYSGTNAGGNLVIKDSVWRNNIAGIVPNTLDSQEGAPQGHINGGIRIENNEIYNNNNFEVPVTDYTYVMYGVGVALAGGHQNDVIGNEIRDHAKYGVAVFPMIDEGFYRPKDNLIAENTVTDSGRADLALAAPAAGNRFVDNEFGSSRPAAIERRDGSIGDPLSFVTILRDYLQTEYGGYPSGETADQPTPDPQPNMPEPDGPPKQTIGGR